jgi:hypothetical protein
MKSPSLTRSVATLAALAALCGPAAANAASISLEPASSTALPSDGSVTLSLIADFTGVQTIGGGIDISVAGPLALASFTPSAFFLARDPAFSGFGAELADSDFEVHVGEFAGFTGRNSLGDLQFTITGTGVATVGLAINSFFGPFFDVQSRQIDVSFTGAEVQVVPLPAAGWFLLTGVGLLARRALRRTVG